jgi:predicted ester cyclase
MTEDVEYRDDGWHKPMHGHADVREFIETTWRATPDMTFELLAGPYVIPGEPRAAFHWRGWGTQTGPLDPPGFAPTGRRWELDGVDFHEYRDGRICKLRIAFDMMTASRQLGLMPAAGSRAERALAMAQRSASRVQRAIRQRRSG